ncbi:uncharacterized protein LOC106641999 [Copidosoma floridanum]|uniref:uncharacterized protein LOC106641999 n=1 Tax=Copidosoma floridanum TaxID=29053 RepID=UPI0006C95E2D|nr:uncharacterized protein LOC106641999 [Copidosoma floridanum]
MTTARKVNDWTGFAKLRNEASSTIEAAMCYHCKKIFQMYSQELFISHRNQCNQQINDSTSQGVSNSSNDKSLEYSDFPDNSDVQKVTAALHVLLAKFFVTANIPFKQVENKHFLNFIKGLIKSKINYEPPCRETLATTIFKKLHEKVEKEKKIQLQNTESVLLVDGWRNKSTNQKYLFFTLRNVNVQQTFLNYFEYLMDDEDDENVSTQINRAIMEAKEKYSAHVYAIVTENDSELVRSARMIHSLNHKLLIQSTCASDSGYLLIKSFEDDYLVAMIREIFDAFKPDSKIEALLLKEGGTRLKALPETHWRFLRDSCFHLLENLEVLKNICDIGEIDLRPDVIECINSLDFENTLIELLNNLDPLCELISKCRDPKCNVADVAEYWLSFKLPTSQYDDIITARKDKAIWPVGYAANLLHHKYEGKLLDKAQKLVATDFLKEEMDALVFEEYRNYELTKEDYKFYADNCNDPVAYWKLVGMTLPDLSKFVVKIMLLPASTALIDSLFSNWTYVHDACKDRLNGEHSPKLVDVYYSLMRDLSIQ